MEEPWENVVQMVSQASSQPNLMNPKPSRIISLKKKGEEDQKPLSEALILSGSATELQCRKHDLASGLALEILCGDI